MKVVMSKQDGHTDVCTPGEAAACCDPAKFGPLRSRYLWLPRHPLRRLSVRKSLQATLVLLVAVAAAQLIMNLQAISSAAYMLRRAEISNRQLSTYQQLSIDMLEYLLAEKGPDISLGVAMDRQGVVKSDLEAIDGLESFEVDLVRGNGGDETNAAERARLVDIRAMMQLVFLSDRVSTTRPAAQLAAIDIYRTALKPLMGQAIDGERAEIAAVEQAMRKMQGRIIWFGRIGILIQMLTVAFVLLLVTKAVLGPISRLVADIREFGRDHLGHRVDVPRHDEFGLLAQHINRMARHLDRGRRSLVAINGSLEATVAERTHSLQEKNDELREIDESRRRFFANVSHELRTPLTAIVGEADVTLRTPDSDVQACREALSSIFANSTYLNRRIDDLMALARSLDGQLELQSEIVDLNIVATEAMAEIRSLARVNCVIPRFEPLDRALLVKGDRSRLRQCLMILLDNAVKFSRAYQVVEVVLVDCGSQAHLTVVDQGKGIAIEELPRVFDRYYQTKVGRRMGGTGLGLSIARHIVEAHKGSIAAENNAEGGAAMTITLPLTKELDS